MSFDKDIFKRRLKQLRESAGMTQNELGSKLGITRNAISGYESGTREPDIEKLVLLSDVFDCTLDYLTGKSDNKTNKYSVAIDKNKLKEINLDDLDLIKELIRKLQQ